MNEGTREDRHVRRWGARIGVGAAIGGSLGLVIGAIWGSIAYRAGSSGMWVVVIGCVIFLMILGAFVGGMSGLESPDPGREPSEVAEPLADPDLTDRERGAARSR
jgi:hypothetical protein